MKEFNKKTKNDIKTLVSTTLRVNISFFNLTRFLKRDYSLVKRCLNFSLSLSETIAINSELVGLPR